MGCQNEGESNGISLMHMSIRDQYQFLGEEAVVINALAATLLALMIIMPAILLYDKFRSRPVQVIAVHGI